MTFQFLLLGNCADPFLGKIDTASLSQQTLMDIFVSTIENKEIMLEVTDNPDDISEWHGLTFNDAGEITQIDFSDWGFKGSINVEWLPSSTETLRIDTNSLSGSLRLDKLPEKLVSLNAFDNMFNGTVCFEKLPRSMEYLLLQVNRLTGTVCLTKLPPQMIRLDLEENLFFGTVDLTCLPPSMSMLYLSSNNFTGSTDFGQLPEGLWELNVSNTQMEGEIRVPKGMYFSAENTKVVVLK